MTDPKIYFVGQEFSNNNDYIVMLELNSPDKMLNCRASFSGLDSLAEELHKEVQKKSKFMFFLSYSTDAQKVSYKKLNELNLYILREKNISEEFIDMVSKKVFKHEGEFTIPSSHYKPFTIKQFKELKIYFNQIDKEKKYETIFEFAPLDIKN